jgi:hypothetical protein
MRRKIPPRQLVVIDVEVCNPVEYVKAPWIRRQLGQFT